MTACAHFISSDVIIRGHTSMTSSSEISIQATDSKILMSGNTTLQDITLDGCVVRFSLSACRDMNATGCSIDMHSIARDIYVNNSDIKFRGAANNFDAEESILFSEDTTYSFMNLQMSYAELISCSVDSADVDMDSFVSADSTHISAGNSDGLLYTTLSDINDIVNAGSWVCFEDSGAGGTSTGALIGVLPTSGLTNNGAVIALGDILSVQGNGSGVFASSSGNIVQGDVISVGAQTVQAINAISVGADACDADDALIVGSNTVVHATNVVSAGGDIQADYVVCCGGIVSAALGAITVGDQKPTATTYISVLSTSTEINVAGTTRLYAEPGSVVNIEADVTDFVADTVLVP